MSRSYSVKQLAEIVGGSARGDEGVVITGVAEVSAAGPDDAAWVSNPKYAPRLESSRAGVVLVPEDFGPTPMTAILCPRTDRSVARLLGAFASPDARPEPGIHPTTQIHETARIGSDPAIGPHVVIEADARVGDATVIHAGVYIGRGTTVGNDCVIWPNAVIRDGCRVGNRVIIHSNAVIGADGLGFYFDEGAHHKVPHIGGVILEDDVEVGACACVDRAKFGHTVVGRGTKIDNLVQLAHNVKVGEHCVIAAQTGVAGSVHIGDYAVFGGQVGVADNVTIGSRARCAGGMTMVAKDVPDGMTVSGFTAQDHRRELRERAAVRRLPALAEQLKELIARVEQLEASTHHRE